MCVCVFSPPFSDPTLTINNLRSVMQSVKNWYNLGQYNGGLGVPQTVCDVIRDSIAYKTAEEKKEILLLYYLHTVPMASWPSVAGALHYRQEKTALLATKIFLRDKAAG